MVPPTARQLLDWIRLGFPVLILCWSGYCFARPQPPATQIAKDAPEPEEHRDPVRDAASVPAEERYKRPPKSEIRKRLTNMQYRVTQSDATEPAFRNAYWNNKEAGIYVDIVSGEPLFSSLHKFRSGTGWPSFYRPINPAFLVQKRDFKMGWPRIEVRSRHGDSHLGHVFSDGPRPTGLRFCINSAALRFIPAERLEAEGYGEFLPMFAGQGKPQFPQPQFPQPQFPQP